MLEDLTFKSLGVVNYHETLDLMKSHIQQADFSNEIWLLEHPPIFTLGTAADKNHILEAKDIPVVQSDRGGEVTYHGPGQLVVYPIIDLSNYKKSISWYMRAIEQVSIDTLSEYDIQAVRNLDLTGVWVEDEKIAAQGVKISRWVTMHGFSINVNTNLDHYNSIIPCGIFDRGVTSMSKLLGRDVNIDRLKLVVQKHFNSNLCKNDYPN